MPKLFHNINKRIFNPLGIDVRRVLSANASRAYSNLDEEKVIQAHLKHLIGNNTGYCVDIAASDGVSMSNTLSLFLSGWNGLAVEYDAKKFGSLAHTYSDFKNVGLSKCMVTPPNVLSLLSANGTPKDFDFLNLDIDGYDYYVLEQIMSAYRPKLICAEINEKIPPPIKFSVKWNPSYCWAGDHFYGQSIAQLYELALRNKYVLVELHYNNAFLIPLEYQPTASYSAEDAYREGYKNKADRKKKFPWNSNMDALLDLSPQESMVFIRDYFKKYEGRFDISL